MRSGGSKFCVVMACADKGEAEAVSKQLLQHNNGYLVTYRRVDDIIHNQPTEKVTLVILSVWDNPAHLGRIIRWLKHRWPTSPVAVVGNEGGGEDEMAARMGGALFLTRPVFPNQWSDLLEHVLRSARARTIPDQTDANLAEKPSHQ